MRKLLVTLATLVVLDHCAMSQTWDRHMLVKKMDIRIKTDAFTATTFIEMEFYNPTQTEMEGLYPFELEPGQAITAFQLDLSGKYRDGSIEEKWKARNAYNTIVGKRVDPALLQMEYYNHYSLRIYPVPAKRSRKITLTIQQLLVINKETAVYTLPLKINDVIEQLNVHIMSNGCSASPTVIPGLFTNQSFINDKNIYELSWQTTGLKADKPLSFSIPLSLQKPSLCLKNINGKTFFAMRFKPGIRKEYAIQPEKITVFWDVSASGSSRNISKEIAFMKQYVSINKIRQLTIIPFNHQALDTAVFYTAGNFNIRWVEYLQSLRYEGATQLGVLDFSTVNADAVLLFSDGKNSFGKNLPVPGQTHIYCINSASYPDTTHLEKIIGQSGGRYINLTATTIAAAVETAGKAENILLSLSSSGTQLIIDQKLPDLKEDILLLTGIIPPGDPTMTLSYGNNGNKQAEEKIAATGNNLCDESVIDRIHMLSVFDSYAKSNSYWMDVLSFGKAEKVVTPSTAFIVLEKIEDYIRFNITPPKELESQCDMKIFVKVDEEKRKQYKKLDEFDVLTSVANAYNERITWWDKNQPLITLTEEKMDEVAVSKKEETQPTKPKVATVSTPVTAPEQAGTEKVVAMSEVVVVAMGQTRPPRELGYSVSVIRGNELTQTKAVNLQNELTGKVSGLNIQTIDNGVFGNTRITLRGIRSLTGNNQPMLILDGVPIDLKYISSLNPNDILSVTILKSASATAIYGPDGVNGALIVQSRKGSHRSYSYYRDSYKLKDCDDEDYLAEIKTVVTGDKIFKYNELKKTYGDEAGFYFDMAQHLFESGYHQEALVILFSAADITGGDLQVLKAMGYMLEAWKQFDEAIKLYREILSSDDNDLQSYRNLALAYYQNGNYQQSVDVFYKGILKGKDNYENANRNIKSMMLQEMNAIIAVHRDILDLSKINNQLIRPLTTDLRVTFDCNNRDLYSNISVAEPDGKICSYYKTESVHGGRMTTGNNYYYYDYTDAPEEYQIKVAQTGKYKLRVSYWDYGVYGKALKIPTMIKITTFKNFGKPNQSMEIENVIMDNQYGEVEIGEVKW